MVGVRVSRGTWGKEGSVVIEGKGKGLGACAELRWSPCFVAFNERWQRSEVLTEQTAEHLPGRPVRGSEGLLAHSLRLTLRELSGAVWVAGHRGFFSCPEELCG